MNKVLLIILDGWGIAQPWGGNAIAIAKTPYYDYLWRYFPHTQLSASGRDVGLPGNEMGNSEVGHMNIGAGKIVNQDILRVNQSIEDGSFYINPVLIKAMQRVRGTSNNLHLMGLLSDGGVHSHIAHAIALLNMAKLQGVKNVYLHIFTDGRDTQPMGAQIYIARIKEEIKKLNLGTIATVSGRYWAMDRDGKWQRVDKTYKAMTQGIGISAQTAMSAVAQAYGKGETDEFITPTVIAYNGKKPPPVKSGDSIIYWNFRSDRARQLTQAFLKPEIKGYNRAVTLNNLYFVSFIPYGYEKDIGVMPNIVFTPEKIAYTIASVLSQNKIPQLHIAETEKYAHVTYFFNGTVENPYPLEDRVIVPSQHVNTYDLMPEMSAPQITEKAIESIKENKYGFVVINYANTDMVGHSGNFNAIIKACEVVDTQINNLIETSKKYNYYTILTADHGNAEEALNPINNEVSTEHTTNPVPFILIPPAGDKRKYILKTSGRLSDIAPTIFNIMAIEKPAQMTGINLIAINYQNR